MLAFGSRAKAVVTACLVAAAIAFGHQSFTEVSLQSGAALATVAGVLIEVPVMLSVVKIINATKGWYDRGRSVRSGKPLASQHR
ncbi:MAG: hypothetical protein E6Q98_19670 [Rhodospirillaceae bacterium]|nr:MAG: hypothetical protein E6Q98_19670 [Rhodospirillaceae bacterium]